MPANTARAPKKRRTPSKAHRALPQVYEPGHFTALVHANNWPPGWVSQWQPDTLRHTAAHQRGFRAAKAAAAQGTSWASARMARQGMEPAA